MHEGRAEIPFIKWDELSILPLATIGVISSVTAFEKVALKSSVINIFWVNNSKGRHKSLMLRFFEFNICFRIYHL